MTMTTKGSDHYDSPQLLIDNLSCYPTLTQDVGEEVVVVPSSERVGEIERRIFCMPSIL